MIGRRVYIAEGQDPIAPVTQAGDYALDSEGRLWLRDPTGAYCHLSPTVHSIVEHEDGTVTVSPSILRYAFGDVPEWHGYLERGAWRTV